MSQSWTIDRSTEENGFVSLRTVKNDGGKGDLVAGIYDPAQAALLAAAPRLKASLKWAITMAIEAITHRENSDDPEDTAELTQLHRAELAKAQSALSAANGIDLLPEDRERDVECSSCDWTGIEGYTLTIQNFFERVLPGETMPAGECPHCGALAHLVGPARD